MEDKISVAVIGASGFVGDACCHIFREQNVHKIDPRLGTSVADILDKELDLILICVPTPQGTDGKINSSIVESVLDQLKGKSKTLIALKSTTLPDVVAKYEKQFKNFVYNPEFLTEARARFDAENPTHTVIGGSSKNCARMQNYYENYSTCASAPFITMSASEASFVKYGMNCFLATKVLFFNQYYDMVTKSGAAYEKVRAGISADPRIGVSHTLVPGNDGRRGFSGACFPKDVTAMVHFSDETLTVLKEAWNANCDYRHMTEPTPRELEQHVEFNKI